jgi:hypothetical protein
MWQKCPGWLEGAGSADLDIIVRRVREEFREMPGLRLTPAQATRLWGLESEMCDRVIAALVASAFLRWTPTGVVRRMDS